MPVPSESENPYVSRGGLKLHHAIETFDINVAGLACADLGCSTGGFTDCLLQHGAASVTCVDTAYGQLAWKLRSDERATVMERANALHAEPAPGGVDLVVMDLGWTPQRLAIPAAKNWLRENGQIISLIKPHYEHSDRERSARGTEIMLEDADAERIARETADSLSEFGCKVDGFTKSPIVGGGKRSKRKSKGNAEWLVLLSLSKG